MRVVFGVAFVSDFTVGMIDDGFGLVVVFVVGFMVGMIDDAFKRISEALASLVVFVEPDINVLPIAKNFNKEQKLQLF
jgi:ABC-type multidrug transport system fused ATPase/permease subunit